MNEPAMECPTVLVVEDELIVATDLEASLQQLGYHVLGIAETGTEAVSFAEQKEPDLVLMDIRLPGPIDGIAAAQDIRRRLDIPIVFLTAFAGKETVDRAREAQPFGYLTKPFRPDELNATLTMALRQHQAQEERREVELEREMKATSDALVQSRVELGALAGRLLTTLEEERRRIARELHDDLGHRTAKVDLWAGVVQKLVPDASPEVHDAIHHLRSHARDLGNALNHTSPPMHPSVVEVLGLEPAVRHVVDEHRWQGETVDLNLGALPSSIPPEVAFVVYRILQEAFRNIRRHSRKAPANVSLDVKGRELRLTIEDKGHGFDLEKERSKGAVGLTSMQERVRLVGGVFSIKTAPGEGVCIEVRVPLRGVD